MAKKSSRKKKTSKSKTTSPSKSKRGRTSKPLCFVLMPFSHASSKDKKYHTLGEKELDTIFELVRGIVVRCSYEVRRASGKGDILRDIVLDLDRAELVIADLTGLNPNVMYELGIRHGFTKKTILLTQDIEEIPFDLKSYHCIEYGWMVKTEKTKLARDIRECLKSIQGNPDTRFGPVHSHLGTKRLAVWEEEKQATVRKLSSLIAELQWLANGNIRCLKTLAKLYPDAIKEVDGTLDVDFDKLKHEQVAPIWGPVYAKWPRTLPSMDLLLSTGYIDARFDEHGDIAAFVSLLGGLRMSGDSLDDSVLSFKFACVRIDNLLRDASTILDAVDGDMFGARLDLWSTSVSEESDAT